MQTKIVDRRVTSDVGEYGIAFAARNTSGTYDYEHAFVVWYYSDNQHNRTNRKGAGFYPSGDQSYYDLLIGGTDGVVFDDSKERIAKQLVVLVNADVFATARNVQSQYSQDATYRLGLNDCVTFVASVADSVPGLTVPNRILHISPSLFISALFEQN